MKPTAPPNAPKGTMSISIQSRIRGNNLVLRLRSAEAVAERTLHLGILLDNSGSMEGHRLTAVKRTLHAARGLLRTADRITLVTFSSTATIRLREHALTDDPASLDQVYAAVDAINTEGSTNLEAGLQALFSVTTAYDAVLLLTDGIVNQGITSTTGLRVLAQSPRPTMVFHTLGYGAEHNRSLLRDLSIQSRGTYTYVDSDEILPLAVGDILSGLRAEALRGVKVRLPSTWGCCEVDTAIGTSGYYVGNLMTGRDYWTVFQYTGTLAPSDYPLHIQVSGDDGLDTSVTLMGESTDVTDDDVQDQVMRAKVTVALKQATDALEASRAADTTTLRALQTELEGLPPRPLLVRLRAQVAEVVELLTATTVITRTATAPSYNIYRGSVAETVSNNHLMARMSSGMACLSNQRGVYRTLRPRVRARAEDEDEMADVSFFSTPSQRTASQVVHSATQVADADDEPHEPILRIPALMSYCTPGASVQVATMEEIE